MRRAPSQLIPLTRKGVVTSITLRGSTAKGCLPARSVEESLDYHRQPSSLLPT